MTLEAAVKVDDGTVDFTAVGSELNGDVVEVADGRCGIIVGLNTNATAGDILAAQVKGKARLKSGTAVTHAVGVIVDWKNSTASTIATTSGDFNAGLVVVAKVSGDLDVLIDLNTLAVV